MKPLLIIRPAGSSQEKSIAEKFAENLKAVLSDEGCSQEVFINHGTTSGARRAKELLAGRSLPSPQMVKYIARWLKIDPDRLLKEIDPELLKILV